MNKVVLMGRLTKDPEVRNDVATYTLAVNRKYKTEDRDADFIRCVVFGNGADFVDKYLKKGMKISVVGRIQTGSYEDRDGNMRYTTDVIVEEHEFAEPKKEDGGTSGGKRAARRK